MRRGIVSTFPEASAPTILTAEVPLGAGGCGHRMTCSAPQSLTAQPPRHRPAMAHLAAARFRAPYVPGVRLPRISSESAPSTPTSAPPAGLRPHRHHLPEVTFLLPAPIPSCVPTLGRRLLALFLLSSAHLPPPPHPCTLSAPVTESPPLQSRPPSSARLPVCHPLRAAALSPPAPLA